MRVPFLSVAPLIAGLSVAACDVNDRVLTAKCRAAPDEAIYVDVGKIQGGSLGLGRLNVRQLQLGSVLEIVPDGPRSTRDTVVVRHLMNAPARQITRSQGGATYPAFVELEIDMDPDLREALQQRSLMGVDEIAGDTRILVADTLLVSIPDALERMNMEPRMVEVMRASHGNGRFAVISSVLLGGDVFLTSSLAHGVPVATNTFKVAGLYAHISYVCPAVDHLRAVAISSAARIPLFVFLTPVAYDESHHRIVEDSRPPDDMKFGSIASPQTGRH
jgi:hypothetical protein